MTCPPETEELAPRWRPDEALVAAVLAGSRTTLADLAAPDKAWVIAHLKREGETAELMADRLDCSVRTVRGIWSDAGVLVALYLDEAENFERTLRMQQADVVRLSAELAEACRDRDRYLAERNRMIERAMSTEGLPTFGCGCPRTRYNTYIAPKTGKAGCRRHRTLAQQRYRQRLRAAACG